MIRKALYVALLLAALTICSSMIQAQQPTVDEILQRFSEASSALNSLITSYRQIEKDEFGDETVLSGTFYYLKPGRYRWVLEVGGKVVEEMVSNNDYGWRIRHNVKAVDKVKLETIKRRTGGITVTGGAEELKANYNIEYIGIEKLRSGPSYHLRCVPKDGDTKADSLIHSMDLWIDVDEPAPLVKLVLQQRDNIQTTLEFSNLQRNAEVNPDLFVYRVPRGYEEITYEE
jgi:outer membrane lipoprotein-sorting protein